MIATLLCLYYDSNANDIDYYHNYCHKNINDDGVNNDGMIIVMIMIVITTLKKIITPIMHTTITKNYKNNIKTINRSNQPPELQWNVNSGVITYHVTL